MLSYGNGNLSWWEGFWLALVGHRKKKKKECMGAAFHGKASSWALLIVWRTAQRTVSP